MHLTGFVGTVDSWGVHILATMSLASGVLLGYLAARHARARHQQVALRLRRELLHGRSAGRDIQESACTLRKLLTRHHARLDQLREQIGRLGVEQQETEWESLCRETEEVLALAVRLATQVASDYDAIREQANQLPASVQMPTDSLTGVSCRRVLDEALAAHLAMSDRYGHGFCLAIVGIDPLELLTGHPGRLEGDRLLQRVARLLGKSVRETDLLARYGDGAFAVLMPQTDLEGAAVYGERLRAEVEQRLFITVTGGVTASLDGDDADSLLARAVAALDRAKAAGGNCVCRHDGERIEPVLEEVPASAAE
jgi:diguanylate cyclase (GGDEF)-like protein